ncbi:uncharacterized protein [Venturia canescens]|uniref:uncharacterized protein n=1 Tax=Venturia canescens TaxID=32260 RepID=UPI001C9CE783|nr:uncharacterized protein LOC122416005 [Venturia canescens]
MKTFVIVTALFLGLALAEEDKRGPLGVVLNAYGDACAEELKTSEESLSLIKKLEGAEKEDVQCYWACVFQKANLMKDAKIQFEAMEEAMKKVEGADHKMAEKVIEIFKSCKDEAEVNDNPCNVIGNYGKCVLPKLHAER